MSEKMRVAVITGVKQVEIREMPVPRPHSDEVLVRLRACGLCTWEQRAYSGIAKVNYPFAGGHEYSGEIAEIGEGTNTELKVGDRVAIGISGCGDSNTSPKPAVVRIISGRHPQPKG